MEDPRPRQHPDHSGGALPGAHDPLSDIAAEEEVERTVRRPAAGRRRGDRGAPQQDAAPGYGGAEAMSYAGSASPVPTGEHVVAGHWAEDEVAESAETTTGTYPVQVPDGGYDGYAPVGAGAYRSGGIDPYGGQDPATMPWSAPASGPEVSGASYGAPVPGVGAPRGSYGYGAGAQGPAGPYAPAAPHGPAGPGGAPSGGQGRGPLIAVLVILGVVVLGAGAYFLIGWLGDDGTTDATTPAPTTTAPSDPGTTDPGTTSPPQPGQGGSAGGDGDVSGSAYVVDTAGNDLGARLNGAFPAAGQYTSTLRVTERSVVAVGAFSPDLRDLTVSIEGEGVSEELTDSGDEFSFFGFSGFPYSDDPAGLLVLEPGDYEMVITEEDDHASAFELVVITGTGEVAAGEQVDVAVEPQGAELYSVTLDDEDEDLTVTLTGDSTDPYLQVVGPDGEIETNDDWGSSSSFTGDLPSGLDSGLTVSRGAGDYVIVVYTYAGRGGDVTLDVSVD